MTDKVKIITEIFDRFVGNTYPNKEAVFDALKNKKLKIYLGIDPTGPHLHLGHATNLIVLKKLQKLGHEIVLLIGDFTARIGDPTDRLAARKPLTAAEVRKNLKTFKAQAAKIINFSGPNAVRLVFNSKWHAKMTFEKVIELASHFTEQQIIERDMFRDRLKTGRVIGLHEFLYPLMQGYDSVALNVDMEIGGTDQTFNMLAGRKLQKIFNRKEKFVLTTKLLEHPQTGKKLMNKSEGGLINLDDAPDEMFGKLMALDDASMFPIARLSTEMPLARLSELETKVKNKTLNPRDAKIEIAEEVVSLYCGKKEAKRARKEFVRVFSKKEAPEEAEKLEIMNKNIGAVDLLIAAGVKSRSEARRLIEQGAVSVDNAAITDPDQKVASGKILKIGKHRFFEIVWK